MLETQLQTKEPMHHRGERKEKTSKKMGADRKLSQGREKDAPAEAYLLTSSPRASHDSSVSLKPNFSSSSRVSVLSPVSSATFWT